MASTSPVVLVTGASSGIGAAIALEYAKRGCSIVLLARRKDRLAVIAEQIEREGGAALPLTCDVNAEGEIEAAVATTKNRFGRLDAAIANAGIGARGTTEQLSVDDFRRVMETNFFGVLRTAKAALPSLKESRGRFAVITSVNAYLALPAGAPYAASKFAARGLTEALTAEWRPLGVSVTHVAPGFVDSEIRVKKADGTIASDAKDPVPAWLVMETATAARQIVDAVESREREIVVTGHGKIAAALARHVPSIVSLALRVAKR